jgi:hypothetical protein
MMSEVKNGRMRDTWVELHDSRVAEAGQQPDGTYLITFAHLNVFERIAEDDYEVWGYRAHLRITGACGVALPAEISEDDRVVDGSVMLADGMDVSEDTARFGLGARFSNCRIKLCFASGSVLSAAGEEIAVESAERLKFLEHWTGPLKSS